MDDREIADAFITGFMCAGGSANDAVDQAAQYMSCVNAVRPICAYCHKVATHVGLYLIGDNEVSRIPVCDGHVESFSATRPIKPGDVG